MFEWIEIRAALNFRLPRLHTKLREGVRKPLMCKRNKYNVSFYKSIQITIILKVYFWHYDIAYLNVMNTQQK